MQLKLNFMNVFFASKYRSQLGRYRAARNTPTLDNCMTSRFPNPQVGGSIPPQEGVQHDSFCLPQKELGFACGGES
jgi:hypothetical protein